MNRLGFRINDLSIVKQRIDDVRFVPQMIIGHFACADIPGHERTARNWPCSSR